MSALFFIAYRLLSGCKYSKTGTVNAVHAPVQWKPKEAKTLYITLGSRSENTAHRINSLSN